MIKKRIVLICPGRGSYTRNTSNYLGHYGYNEKKHIKWIDNQRNKADLPLITELDSQIFKAKSHMVGENASSLIYACSLSDFLTIDTNKYEIVSITGNSMGWYTALSLSGAITKEDGYFLIEKMGSMMKDVIIGGQMIYPISDDHWRVDTKVNEMVLSEVKNVGAHVSIKLGGYLVIGGDKSALDILYKKLPNKGEYPLMLPYHAAFHTPLLEPISRSALQIIDPSIFKKPIIPIIDGRGKIWSPFSTNPLELMDYTLNYQVLNPFDFTSSITVALKEFCPDLLVLLGPGNSLGGAVGQIMVKNRWLDIKSKKDFIDRQDADPYIISMGIRDQRSNL